MHSAAVPRVFRGVTIVYVCVCQAKEARDRLDKRRRMQVQQLEEEKV